MSLFSRIIGSILVGLTYGACLEDIVHGQLLYQDVTTNVVITLGISAIFGIAAFLFLPGPVKEILES